MCVWPRHLGLLLTHLAHIFAAEGKGGLSQPSEESEGACVPLLLLPPEDCPSLCS